MSNFSDHNTPDPTSTHSPTVLSGSCKVEAILHDKPEQARQNALAHLSQAQAALHQWRRSLEAEGALYGAIHTYPHHKGITRHNYYPDAPNSEGKKRRIYVSLDNLPHYRAEIERGQQCDRLQQMEAQIVSLVQSARSLA